MLMCLAFSTYLGNSLGRGRGNRGWRHHVRLHERSERLGVFLRASEETRARFLMGRSHGNGRQARGG